MIVVLASVLAESTANKGASGGGGRGEQRQMDKDRGVLGCLRAAVANTSEWRQPSGH